nr:septal ring lytic transglycosylase RlpA family protein [uncultured Albidiferax sp.]
MFEKRLIVWLLLLSFLPGCSTTLRAQPLVAEEPSTEAPEPASLATPLATNPSDFWATDLGAGTAQRGKASWYGKRFHGRRTASGEVFKMSELTAAHRTLPLLSYAKVTLLSNGKSVIVRINDRGPHILTHRVIDLSQAAAAELGLLAMGTGDVLVERVVARTPDDPPSLSKK